MNKGSFLIDIALKESNCNVLSPGHEYTRDDFGIVQGKKERGEKTYADLAVLISNRMQAVSQHALAETLAHRVPQLYIDCANKGTDDIMTCIFKACIQQYSSPSKEAMLATMIGSRTIIIDTAERDHRIRTENPSREAMLAQYSTLLQSCIQRKGDEPKYIDAIYNYESDLTFAGLAEYMTSIQQQALYLHLDAVGELTTAEQQRINMLLYSRGNIRNDKRIRLKINNGGNQWKTRTTHQGHRVEATHDYCANYIGEKDF